MQKEFTKLFKKNKECRYCNSRALIKFLSLGDQPPSNSFIKKSQISKEEKFPLDVYFCEDCFLVQLLDVVPGKIIFDDYLYLSSNSKALSEHYRKFTVHLTKKFKLKKDDLVVDIGSNDGILLKEYGKQIRVLGIEPSRVADVANKSGIKTLKVFFEEDVARGIVKKYGYPKIVTATNVFAHVDDIQSFVKGLPVLLGNTGVLIIEVPYLIDLINKIYFDTIYHEHLCYLSLTPVAQFLERFDLVVFDAERIPFGASGPAIRIYVKSKGNPLQVKNSVKKILNEEKKWGVRDINKYRNYSKKIDKVKIEVLKIINGLHKSNATIGGYGAPAKGNTLLNYFGIDSSLIEFIAETNKYKQGLVTPGTHIEIISEEEFLEKNPDYALLLSWNYVDYFLRESEYIKKGGKFIVPLPKPQILPV